jgi:threonine dehydratase
MGPPEALIPVAAVAAAADRLGNRVVRTPLLELEFRGAGPMLLKLECLQHTGSFKLRGALNAVAVLTEGERARGLVTASAGNHGQAVARAAREYGTRAVVYVPADAPRRKQDRIRGYGAELHAEASDYDAAEGLAREHARREGSTLVHAFSDPAVVAGQGTVGLELAEAVAKGEAAGVTDVLIPVGGGGLAAGVGLVLRALLPHIRITGVQSSRTRAMYEAFRAGGVVPVPVPPTLADGLAGCTDQASYRRVRQVLDDLVLVEESDIASAIRALHETGGVVAEGAGAVGVAALLSGAVRPEGRAIVIVSGGNIDDDRLASILGEAA